MLSREWRCSWSSADRRCSNYIWVIDNFIAYYGASYIREFTVFILLEFMMTSGHVNTFDLTDALWGESTGDRSPPKWVSNAELWCILICQPGQAVKQTVEQISQWPLIGDAMTLMWRHCNVTFFRNPPWFWCDFMASNFNHKVNIKITLRLSRHLYILSDHSKISICERIFWFYLQFGICHCISFCHEINNSIKRDCIYHSIQIT